MAQSHYSFIFVGGPGRSGTSFTAARIGDHPQVASFRDIELKFLCEYNGLYDLRRAFTEDYSPNRAVMALRQFGDIWNYLFVGNFPQSTEDIQSVEQNIRTAYQQFVNELAPNGFPRPIPKSCFNACAARFMRSIAAIAAERKSETTHFLEKTPHNLLQPLFLHEIAPQCKFLHVTRDPRAIAFSLRSQPWGPDTIEESSIWVKSYFAQWQHAREIIARFNLPFLEIRIEEIARDPIQYSSVVENFLGLQPHANLFSKVRPDVLHSWQRKVSKDELNFLDNELSGLKNGSCDLW